MQARQWHDWAALPMHLILGGVVSHYLHADRGYSNGSIARLILILTIEVLSFIFNAWVVAGWYFATETTWWLHTFRDGGTIVEKWNKWKWLQYAFTATLGGVAVALKTYDTQPVGTVVSVVIVISIVGIVQSLQSYFVDMPFKVNGGRYFMWALTAVGQGIEFLLVTAVLDVDPRSALFVVYASMRSAFVGIALIRAFKLEGAFPPPSIVDWFDIDNTEAMYSGLGWMASLAIGGTTVADIVSPDTTTAVGAALAAATGVVLFATIATMGPHRTLFWSLHNAL